MSESMSESRTHRITLERDGHTSLLSGTVQTRSDGQQWFTILHVEVPPPLQGQGIAGTLVEQAFTYAAANHLQIALVCPFAIHYAAQHPALQARVGKLPAA